MVPLVSMSTDSPSSGVGGPFVSNVDSGALPAITMRSIVPPETCSLDPAAHIDGASKVGHSRFITAIGIRVPATPKARCGSGRE